MAFIDDLKSGILNAAGNALSGQPQVVVNYLKTEGEKLASTLAMIASGVASGDISKDEAALLLNQQKVAATAVLTSAQGMSLMAAQNAVNAVLAAVANLVNGKVGFALL